MSNIVPLTTTVPAHLANRVGQPSTLAQSMSGGIGSGVEYPRISIKGSRFRIVEGGTESVLDATSLPVIIVGANPGLSKQWYATAWNPDSEPTQPDCFSLGGIVPDQQSAQPQNDLCATCPQNAWGSRVTAQGTKVKACSDTKRLAVIAADDPSGTVYLLQVTPAALKGLNQYQKELSMRGFAPELVRTIVSFDTTASFPKLKFDFGGFADEAAIAEVDKLLGADKVLEITGEHSTQPAIAAPATAGVATASAPEPVAEPVPEPAAATPEVAEETTQTGFGAAKVATTTAPAATVVPPTGETKKTGFGAATVEAGPAPTATPTAPVDEPAKAPAADASTAGLAEEITALMAEVADDA